MIVENIAVLVIGRNCDIGAVCFQPLRNTMILLLTQLGEILGGVRVP